MDKSLLRQRDLSDTITSQRFFLLEPIREYALEKLETAGEADQLRGDHTVYYLQLAEEVVTQCTSVKLESVLEQLEQEHNNMRAALQWTCDSCNLAEHCGVSGAVEDTFMRGASGLMNSSL
jgi:predicted ATPase